MNNLVNLINFIFYNLHVQKLTKFNISMFPEKFYNFRAYIYIFTAELDTCFLVRLSCLVVHRSFCGFLRLRQNVLAK